LGVKELIDGFNTDDSFDPYKPIAELTEVEYKQSKILWLSILYGAGKRSVKNLLQCDDYDAQDVIGMFKDGMPEMEAFKDKLNYELHENGFITDFFGREYPAPHDHSFKLTNLIIQGSACGVLKEAMIACDKILKGTRSYMLQLIHDEIVFQIHLDEMHLVPLLITAMEVDLGFDVPMRVKPEYTTTNWANKKEWTGKL